MSVIVAVKENGVIYMGADSQTTAGKRKYNNLNLTEFKINRLPNGILLGECGKVADEQKIPKKIFTLDANGELNRKHIVKEIIPKIVDCVGNKCVSIVLAYKDSLYRITQNLDVVKLNKFCKIGAGLYFVDYALSQNHLPVRERILKALSESAKRTESVSGPFVLIDTQNLEYEVVDLGGNNH